MTIYLDVIFLENIVINYIILYVTGMISKAQIKQKRLIAGALIGAFYSIIYYLLKLKIYSSFIIKIILSIVIIYVVLITRAINIAKTARDDLGSYIAIGIARNIFIPYVRKYWYDNRTSSNNRSATSIH